LIARPSLLLVPVETVAFFRAVSTLLGLALV
jgi:hypothetical protein